MWTGDDGGALPARMISDLFPPDISGVAKGATRNGATGFEYRIGSGGRRTYGYWMTHSVFGIAEEPGCLQDAPAARFGFAGGNLTGSRPSASAQWTGRMVGTAVEGAAAGTRLIGDAALAWSAAEPGAVDVALCSIRDNADGVPWPVDSILFDDVPVCASGTFGSGASGSIIRGGFHGPDHAEAAGAFEKRGTRFGRALRSHASFSGTHR